MPVCLVKLAESNMIWLTHRYCPPESIRYISSVVSFLAVSLDGLKYKHVQTGFLFCIKFADLVKKNNNKEIISKRNNSLKFRTYNVQELH